MKEYKVYDAYFVETHKRFYAENQDQAVEVADKWVRQQTGGLFYLSEVESGKILLEFTR